MSDPWAPLVPEGLTLWVDGVQRRLTALGVTGVAPGTLPVWTATVDGCLGCGGTLDAAIVLASRAAEEVGRVKA